MAANGGRKSFFFFGGGGGEKRVNPSSDLGLDEFQESDVVWDSGDVGSDHGHPPAKTTSRSSRKPAKGGQRNVAGSLPVNIPDWSRILGEAYRDHHRREIVDDVDAEDGDDEDDRRLPPHEYLARMRGTSFSVHEGVGRTLKGRDLSRVRNAVWKQTGFED